MVLSGPRRSLAFLWACLLLGGGLGSCAEEELPLLEIEKLAFVPAGSIGVGSGALRATFRSNEALLVDRYEVVRKDWRAYLQSLGKAPGPIAEGARSQGDDAWPAVGMTLTEAQAYAESRGMRLPRASEWLWIAGGARAMRHPYGVSPMDSAANSLELGLNKLTPVGTFYNGRTPGDPIFDLQGNAAEWVNSLHWAYPNWLPRGSERDGIRQSLGTGAWAMGGSYLDRTRPLYRFPDLGQVEAVEHNPEYRSSDLGFRCVVGAEAWLEAHRGEFASAEMKDRLVSVGRGWGSRAVGLLADLLERHPKDPMLVALLEGARTE